MVGLGGGLKLGAILTSAVLVLGYLINIVLFESRHMSLPVHRVGVSSVCRHGELVLSNDGIIPQFLVQSVQINSLNEQFQFEEEVMMTHHLWRLQTDKI